MRIGTTRPTTKNKKIKDNNHGHKDGNPPKFEKRPFGNKNNKKKNLSKEKSIVPKIKL